MNSRIKALAVSIPLSIGLSVLIYYGIAISTDQTFAHFLQNHKAGILDYAAGSLIGFCTFRLTLDNFRKREKA
ncbi:hypothetical protein RYA05_03085 [Pseudomonas syringae pv. actinidiae]|nr:hypothetical protein [Pseudomonas syringae pv. actinidiae]